MTDAIEGDEFCEDHAQAHVFFERLEDHPFRQLIVRLVALVLLMILLIPFYYSFRVLYLESEIVTEDSR